MYAILRQLLFFFDAEKVHYFSMNALTALCKIPGVKILVRKLYSPTQKVARQVFGINFPNPVGLAAGFDKNAKYLETLQTLGFGFVEVGTLTPLPQAGNDKPRLFRLPPDKAIINRMGFNNDGVAAAAGRLRAFRKNNKMIIGGNIGKNKLTPNEQAWKDYEICFLQLHDVVDYFVVNVSSPNTPGLRDLQQVQSLRQILVHLQQLNKAQAIQKPLLLKISPDLDERDLVDIIDLAMEIKLDGLVAANTTISRAGLISDKNKIETIGPGGLSGKPLQQRATSIARFIQARTGGSLPFISSGGIFDASDAMEKMDAGASLVQVWTGFIYEGPAIVRKICNGLR